MEKNTKMTNQEILEAKAKAAGLRAEANVYSKAARDAEAAQKAENADQLSIDDVDATVEGQATSEKEEKDAKKTTADNIQKDEKKSADNATQKVNETDEGNTNEKVDETDDGNATKKVDETDDGNATKKVDETDDGNATKKVDETDEGNTNEKVDETDDGNTNEKVDETDDGKAKNDSNKDDDSRKDKKSIWTGILAAALAIGLLILLMVASIANKGDEPDGEPADSSVTTSQPNATEQPSETGKPAFVMNDFVNSVVNIASQYTDADITANTNILCKNIGEDKLAELVEKNGEVIAQETVASWVLIAEIKTQQYIANKALDYNPNAESDYYAKLQAADKAYKAATGKNPDGALMSKEWYESLKTSQTAVKAKLAEEGETELLAWYTSKTTEYSLMWEQIRDTEEALAYKEEVILEIINSDGTIDLLERQLEEVSKGELVVMDNITMKYTDAYKVFVLNNYVYVVAK